MIKGVVTAPSFSGDPEVRDPELVVIKDSPELVEARTAVPTGNAPATRLSSDVHHTNPAHQKLSLPRWNRGWGLSMPNWEF